MGVAWFKLPFSGLALARLLVCVAFASLFLASAWLNDDAYISYRTVENFLQGYGLRWNSFERVQAFTHPLWLALLIVLRSILGEMYASALLLSALSSFAALVIVLFLYKSWPQVICFGLFILSSKAFVDYSSSGLENPLTHLLLALLAVFALRRPHLFSKPSPRDLFILSLLSSLGYLSRPDAVLFFVFMLGCVTYFSLRQRFWGSLWALALGALPFFLWIAFSLFYYGFPFPNTFYAKLGSGIDPALQVLNGLAYLYNSLKWDTVSLAVISAATLLVIWRGSIAQRFLMGGVVLYLAYVVHIGGDFMSGRFLSAPFFLAAIVLVDLFSTSVWLLGFGLLALLLSVSNPRAFFSFRDQSKLKVGGMLRFNDTRRFYAYGTALLPYLKQGFKNTHPFMAQGLRMRAQARTVFVSRAIGMQGYAAGPGKILVDQYALSDALLARLPVKDPWNWRIAHFARRIPKGYLESLGTGQNKIEDPALWQYYEKLRLVTQGPLFSRQRLRTVFEFNLGYYDKWLKQYLQSRPKAP